MSDSPVPTAPPAALATRPSRRRRRLLVLGGIGLALVLATLGYRHFCLERPVGSGPAGPAVPAASFAKVWSTRSVVLVGMGDSITAGYGASPGHGYFDRLVRNTK